MAQLFSEWNPDRIALFYVIVCLCPLGLRKDGLSKEYYACSSFADCGGNRARYRRL
jgi:hypothetical protein